VARSAQAVRAATTLASNTSLDALGVSEFQLLSTRISKTHFPSTPGHRSSVQWRIWVLQLGQRRTVWRQVADASVARRPSQLDVYQLEGIAEPECQPK
jgi:hypothetical protein